MANIKGIFLNGVETVFSTFEEAVNIGTYYLPTDNDFDDTPPSSCSIRCIFENFKERDIQRLAFVHLMQPNDIIGLIPAVDMVVPMSSKGYVTFSDGLYNELGTYTVIDSEIDPMRVLYTTLLRKN